MTTPSHLHAVLAVSAVIIIAGAAMLLYPGSPAVWNLFSKDETHYPGDEVHVHSDFLFYAHGERIRFTDERYQSGGLQVLHPDMHFHDGNDWVIHRHADNLTLGDFFASLGITLASDCLTLDTSIEYCTDETNQFAVFVNNERISTPSQYINQEGDRILFYYGPPNAPELAMYLNEISDESCIYSGLCPERGLPPPESCGLTCEI